MAISSFAFDPPTGWNDSTRFPTYEGSEVQVREDMQELHDQTRDYINSLVTTLNDLNAEDVLDKAVLSQPAWGIRYLKVGTGDALYRSINGNTWSIIGAGRITANLTPTYETGVFGGDGSKVVVVPVDSKPTPGSTHLVSSAGVWENAMNMRVSVTLPTYEGDDPHYYQFTLHNNIFSNDTTVVTSYDWGQFPNPGQGLVGDIVWGVAGNTLAISFTYTKGCSGMSLRFNIINALDVDQL